MNVDEAKKEWDTDLKLWNELFLKVLEAEHKLGQQKERLHAAFWKWKRLSADGS